MVIQQKRTKKQTAETFLHPADWIQHIETIYILLSSDDFCGCLLSVGRGSNDDVDTLLDIGQPASHGIIDGNAFVFRACLGLCNSCCGRIQKQSHLFAAEFLTGGTFAQVGLKTYIHILVLVDGEEDAVVGRCPRSIRDAVEGNGLAADVTRVDKRIRHKDVCLVQTVDGVIGGTEVILTCLQMYLAVDAGIGKVAAFAVGAVIPYAQHQAVVSRILVQSVLGSVRVTLRNGEILHRPVFRSCKACGDGCVQTAESTGLYQFGDGQVSGIFACRCAGCNTSVAYQAAVCVIQCLDVAAGGGDRFVLLQFAGKFLNAVRRVPSRVVATIFAERVQALVIGGDNACHVVACHLLVREGNLEYRRNGIRLLGRQCDDKSVGAVLKC